MKAENLIKLRPNEQILDIVHEDSVPAFPWWLFLFVWIVTPFFFLFPLAQNGVVGILFLVVVVGAGLFMVFRTSYSWYRTALVVTDERIADVNQHGFFDKVATEVEYGDIDEVIYSVKGFVPTVFRYGVIYLRTAGERADIAFRRVHRPIDLHHLIEDLVQEAHNDNDPLVVSRAQKLKSLAESLSDAEVERLAAAVQKRERETASRQFFQE